VSVTVLTTEHLFLAPLSLELVRKRLVSDNFSVALPEIGSASFSPHWPGDALGMFTILAKGTTDPIPYSYVAIERDTLAAVGQLGATSEVDANGAIEIGYGFGVPGRGFATEAVEALVTLLLSSASIVAITANTTVGNVASQRVLEKNGFRLTGKSSNEEDGDLLVWMRN
jgi:[ribosomal protein S5]-alanine N-acetyltransferase